MYMQTHICIFKMSDCCCQPTCFIFACYGCTCKFPSSSINYLLLHNQYVPFPKTVRFRPYMTLLSQKSINTAIISLHKCLFPILFTDSAHHVLARAFFPKSPASFLFFCPAPAFAHSMQEEEQQLHHLFCLFLFLTCWTQRHLLLLLLKKQHPRKAAFHRIHVRDCDQKHLPRTGMNEILQRKGDENTAWMYLPNTYNQMPFLYFIFLWEALVLGAKCCRTRARTRLLNALPKSTVKGDSTLVSFCMRVLPRRGQLHEPVHHWNTCNPLYQWH